MIQPQLDYFGKEASQRYLQDNTPLTDSIIKIAEDNGLNKSQIDRIVETANTTTYLALFKTAEDKYIEFPVADAEKVAEALTFAPKVQETFNDYALPPSGEVTEVNIFPISEDAAEKTASVNSNEVLREHQVTKYAMDKVMEKMAQISGNFSEETSNLTHIIKQAVLSGQNLGHIKFAMEQHLPGKLTEQLFEGIKDNLGILNPSMEVPEKTAQVNPDNTILKKLTEVHAITEEYEKYANYLKLVGATVGKGFTALGRGAKAIAMHPVPSLAVVGAAGIGTVGYKLGKSNAEAASTIFNRIPENYIKR